MSWQRLTRERRHWFDEDAQSAAAAADDFPDGAASLESCGIQHGDMLFVSARPAIPAANSDATELGATEDDAAAETELMRAHPAAEVQGSPLAFRGWDLADETEANPAVPSASQAAASALLQSVRQTLRDQSATGTNGVDDQLEELSRLISLCGSGAHSSSFWSSVASSNTTAASSTPVPSLSGGPFGATRAAHASSAGDLADGATSSEPASADSSARDRSASSASRSRPQSHAQSRPQSHSTDLDGLTTARLDERGNAASTTHNADGHPDATATSAALAESQSQVEYWRDRYTRLRVKAEKMNAAGMSLRNQMDVAALAHEKQLLLLRGRIERRDARIALYERTLRAWERADLARGGDGRVHVEDAETATRTNRQAQLTSLAAAPAVTARATTAHHPTPPRSSSRTRASDPHSSDSGGGVDPCAEHGALRGSSPSGNGAPPSARRVRPDSASRVRPSRPSSGSTPVRAMAGVGSSAGGVGIADGVLSHAPTADESDAPRTAAAAASSLRSNSAAPLVRPASAGRSRRSSGVGTTLGVPISNGPSDGSATADWSVSPVVPLALSHVERDAAALHAASDASLIHSSRSQVRQAVEAAKLARSAHALRGGSAL